jgi:hypothetical protein
MLFMTINVTAEALVKKYKSDYLILGDIEVTVFH